jgi:hypothetical protein
MARRRPRRLNGPSVTMVAVLLAASLASSARASNRSSSDPADTDGPLDIAGVELVRPTTGSPLDVTVAFYRRVARKVFTTGGHLRAFFDTAGDAKPEWIGEVTRAAHKLVLVIASSSGRELARYRMQQPSPRTLVTTIPGSTPANPNGPLAVHLVSTFHRRHGPCKRTCEDRAPDAGTLSP